MGLAYVACHIISNTQRQTDRQTYICYLCGWDDTLCTSCSLHPNTAHPNKCALKELLLSDSMRILASNLSLPPPPPSPPFPHPLPLPLPLPRIHTAKKSRGVSWRAAASSASRWRAFSAANLHNFSKVRALVSYHGKPSYLEDVSEMGIHRRQSTHTLQRRQSTHTLQRRQSTHTLQRRQSTQILQSRHHSSSSVSA